MSEECSECLEEIENEIKIHISKIDKKTSEKILEKIEELENKENE
jgi:hypothetical protein